MTSATHTSASATLDALLSRQTVWRAGRAPIAAPRGEPTGFDALDALLPQHGWPCAALTELLLPCDGVGELALLLPTLAGLTRAGGIVVLVAPPYVPYAPAWRDAGVALANLQIVEADARNALWAFEQALRSGACAAVLGWPRQADAQALRRLQVAAGSGDCLGFAFRDRKHAGNPSPAALRIEYVRGREGGGAWHVRKCRGGNAPAQAFVPRDDGQAPKPRSSVVQESDPGTRADIVPFPLSVNGGEGCSEGANRSGDALEAATASEAKTTPGLLRTGTISAIASSGSPSPQPSPARRSAPGTHLRAGQWPESAPLRPPQAGEREFISAPSSAFAFASPCVETQVPFAPAPIPNPQAIVTCASPDAAGH